MSARPDTINLRKKRHKMSITLQLWCWEEGHKDCPACRKRMFFPRKEGKRRWRLMGNREPASMRFSLEHIVPFPLGGKDVAENFMPLCCACNAEKGDRSPGEFWAENMRQHGAIDRFWADRIAIACNLYLNKETSDD